MRGAVMYLPFSVVNTYLHCGLCFTIPAAE